MSESTHVVLNVPAISCPHCKMAIEGAVRDMEGVLSVSVEVPDKTVSLEFDADRVDLEEIKGAIEEEGYPVVGEHVFGG
ncbi:MAG TPA: heavy-metal-associated domain-containing protein [Thermoleophilia bacterium]|nr:heavy-metal-associated domain-containing protein [Thermoleophilia bacterium]